MARLRLKFFATVGVLAAVSAAPRFASAQDATVQSERHAFRVVTIAEGLENPWSLAFLPNGDMLVTERVGRLRVIRNGSLVPEPIEGVPTVVARGQGGLLEVAVHPQYESNGYIYLTFSKPNADGSQSTTALVRARLDGNRLVDVQELFEADAWLTGTIQYGSRIAFDAAGYLYMTVGDRAVPPTGELEAHPSQNLANHNGTVIRLFDDGRVPSDNPFVGQEGARPEIWSYGHRNPQGLAFHPVTGELFATEHGPQGGDELNIIRPGNNYGWPVIGYGVNYGAGAPIHTRTSLQGMEQPLYFWVPSIGASGLMIYSGDAFPAWKGNVFAGGLARPNGGGISRLVLNEDNIVVAAETLLPGNRTRDIRQGPDGLIYVVLDVRQGPGGRVVRLEPVD